MSIGEKILSAISDQKLIMATCYDPATHVVTLNPAPHAAKIFDALVEEYVQERMNRRAVLELSKEELTIVTGCIDSLGVALTRYNHQWSTGERTIYEEAMMSLGMLDKFSDDTDR